MTQATMVTWGLKPGSNPRTLSIYDSSGALADLGTLNATTHTFTLDGVALVITPEDYGAVGDGVTDDTAALTLWINAINAGPAYNEGRMLARTYAISAPLPNLHVSGAKIVGFYGGNHDIGAYTGTVIKAITGMTGTMLTIAPVEGVTSQRLQGVVFDGINFDCNGIAARGLIIKSLTKSTVRVFVANPTTTGVTLDVATSLGEATDTQDNDFWINGRNAEAPGGETLRLKGSAVGNVSFNRFQSLQILHADATAVVHENSDNNVWISVQIFCAGSATNSIEWQGGATSARGVRDEYYIGVFSTNKPAIAKGTATYTVAANKIFLHNRDTGNGTPTPTVETGATVYQLGSGNANFPGTVTASTFIGALTGTASNVATNANLTGPITSVGNATSVASLTAFTPTVTITGGTGTGTANLAGNYLVLGKLLYLNAVATINYATIPTAISITLPAAKVSDASAFQALAAYNTAIGLMAGTISAGTTTLGIVTPLGAVPVGASGQTLTISGWVHIQ